MVKNLLVTEKFRFAVLLALRQGVASNKHIIGLSREFFVTKTKFDEDLDSGDTYGGKGIRWAIQQLYKQGSITRIKHGWYRIAEPGKKELEGYIRQTHMRLSEYGCQQGLTKNTINTICSLANKIHDRDVQKILLRRFVPIV
jgi:hypothetical protein